MTIDAGIVAVALSAVTTAAAALASYVTIRERVSRHDRSIENFGARLETSEKERTKEHAALVARIAELERRQDVDRAELSRPHSILPRPGTGGKRE